MTDKTTSPTAIAIDESRRLIRVAGPEAADFLQSLVTANVETLPVDSCQPGALLTPQGRILADMMIHRLGDGFLLECDATRADDLFTRLRRYRLRRPIDLAREDESCVWVGWGTGAPPAGGHADQRHPDLGWRWIGPAGDMPPGTGKDDMAPLDHWHARRIAAGVPQGPVDLVPERALMLEAGLDKLGAVDFAKGCYVGQEVTARTHYRGLVKRRLVPVRLDMADANTVRSGTSITEGEATLGTVLSHATTGDDTVCLAAMKLSDLHRLIENDSALRVGDAPARLAIPDWMLPLPEPARTDAG
ncbi:MAG: YgfZ/GcvT domain-containing protein [Candidatus Puniceispirillaceae bacterium]